MNTEKSLKTRIREFQQDLLESGIEIQKDVEGYGYNYADLPKVISIIAPFLKKHGIWYEHGTGYDVELKCNILSTTVYSVYNESDERSCSSIINNEVVLGGMNRFQVEGSGITYFRRYHLVVLLGLITEEDTDAAGKRKNKPKDEASKSKATPTSQTVVSFVDTFKGLIDKKRPVATLRSTLEMYKNQINNDDLKTINNMIKEYEDKP
jgi:hypothetical protein